LHPERELIRLDHPFDAGMNSLALEQLAIHRLHKVKLESLRGRV
jgi:hypothetical protein